MFPSFVPDVKRNSNYSIDFGKRWPDWPGHCLTQLPYNKSAICPLIQTQFRGTRTRPLGYTNPFSFPRQWLLSKLKGVKGERKGDKEEGRETREVVRGSETTRENARESAILLFHSPFYSSKRGIFKRRGEESFDQSSSYFSGMINYRDCELCYNFSFVKVNRTRIYVCLFLNREASTLIIIISSFLTSRARGSKSFFILNGRKI